MKAIEISDEQMINNLVSIVENMQTGWDDDNYEKFSKDFSSEMKLYVNSENYSTQRSEIFPQLGKHKKIEPALLHRNPSEISLILRMWCEKRADPVLLIYDFSESSNNFEIISASIRFK